MNSIDMPLPTNEGHIHCLQCTVYEKIQYVHKCDPHISPWAISNFSLNAPSKLAITWILLYSNDLDIIQKPTVHMFAYVLRIDVMRQRVRACFSSP